jgi:hypothetical protein
LRRVLMPWEGLGGIQVRNWGPWTRATQWSKLCFSCDVSGEVTETVACMHWGGAGTVVAWSLCVT